MSNSIQVVKLSSGEVLVAEVDSSTDDGFLILKNVARVAEVAPTANQAQEGMVNIVMMPFMPFTKASQKLVVGADQIVFMAEPIDDIKDAHKKEFSKIITPTSKGLIIPK